MTNAEIPKKGWKLIALTRNSRKPRNKLDTMPLKIGILIIDSKDVKMIHITRGTWKKLKKYYTADKKLPRGVLVD